MRTFIVVGALLLGGCGYRSADEFRVSSDFSPDQQEAFIEAAEGWFSSVPSSRVAIVIVEDNRANVSPRLLDGMADHCDEGQGAATRLHTFSEPHISPCPGFDFRGDEFRRAVAHEIGHALTATEDHIEEDGHIMSDHLFKTPSWITDIDVGFLSSRL